MERIPKDTGYIYNRYRRVRMAACHTSKVLLAWAQL